MMQLRHVLTALGCAEVATFSEPFLSSVVIDSREAQSGSLFCAFVGENVDGHKFVPQAFANGAIAALVEQVNSDFAVVNYQAVSNWDGTLPVQLQVENTEKALQQIARYWRNQFDVRVIGITGSVGKTTTKEVIHSVLSQRFHTLKSEKNFNTEIGLPLQLLNLRPDHERVVLEMGMYVPGDIALLCSVANPDVGVMTNVGTVHVERTGSREALARGKRELVEALSAENTAILNADDELVSAMADHTPAHIFTYGVENPADLTASDIESRGLNGLSFIFHYKGEAVRVDTPLIGRHSVYTALRAAAVGLVEGLTWAEIEQGLLSAETQLRMRVLNGINNTTLIDDTYNASPQSTIAALDLLADCSGRKIAILGDMLELGSEEAVGHRKVGKHAAGSADILFTVGTRGRLIGAAALLVGMSKLNVHCVADPDQAIPLIQKIMRPNDTILIKASRGAHLGIITRALTKVGHV